MPNPQQMNEALPIMLAADSTFSIPLAIAVESLLESAHRGTVYDIHVLEDGVSSQVKEYISSLHRQYEFTITYHDSSAIVKNVLATKQYPRVAFARFLFDRFLPKHITGRVFYTDADVLFCQDLSPLFSMDMQGHPLAATQALNIVAKNNTRHLHHWASVFNISPGEQGLTYYQNGTLLFDREAWRESHYAEQIIEAGEKMTLDQLLCPDQDVMNAVCCGDIALLPAAYNVIPLFERRYDKSAYVSTYAGDCAYSADELEEAIAKPAVLHYAGVKPQVLLGARYAGEQAFIDFWKKSAWRDYLPYGPASYSRRPESLLNPALKLSEQKAFLQKKARLYNILAHVTIWPLRRRFRRWADGLKKMLQAMEH